MKNNHLCTDGTCTPQRHAAHAAEEGAKTCSVCGHEHKPDGSCDCGCK